MEPQDSLPFSQNLAKSEARIAPLRYKYNVLMFEIVTHACYIHSLLYTVQTVTCPVFFLPYSFIILLLFSGLTNCVLNTII